MDGDCAYLFLDEGGELNFQPKGSRFFTLTSVLTRRPFEFVSKFDALRFDLLECGTDIEYFHASEDTQRTRDQVFGIIQEHLDDIRIDTVLVEKCKTGPSLRPPEVFYPRMLGYLLAYVFNGNALAGASKVIVVTDELPVHKKRNAVVKGIRTHLPKVLPSHMPYRICHHQSKSCYGLQIADYCNWAILRKWKDIDFRSYRLIERAIESEFDIFRTGSVVWYK